MLVCFVNCQSTSQSKLSFNYTMSCWRIRISSMGEQNISKEIDLTSSKKTHKPWHYPDLLCFAKAPPEHVRKEHYLYSSCTLRDVDIHIADTFSCLHLARNYSDERHSLKLTSSDRKIVNEIQDDEKRFMLHNCIWSFKYSKPHVGKGTALMLLQKPFFPSKENPVSCWASPLKPWWPWELLFQSANPLPARRRIPHHRP